MVLYICCVKFIKIIETHKLKILFLIYDKVWRFYFKFFVGLWLMY